MLNQRTFSSTPGSLEEIPPGKDGISFIAVDIAVKN